MRGGVRPEFNKAESTQQPIRRLAVPPQLIVPLQQHMGQVPNLNVAVGDSVFSGSKPLRKFVIPIASVLRNKLGKA